MAILGTISGQGTLVTNGAEAPADYSITVTQSGGAKEGSGNISSSNAAVMAAWTADKSLLRLEDGTEVTVLVTQIGSTAGQAQIKVSGPVPGF